MNMIPKPFFAAMICMVWIAFAGPLFAVIEPSSTPADIVRQATTVAAFDLVKENDRYSVDRESIVAIKGDAAASLIVNDTKEFASAAAMSEFRVVLIAAQARADSTAATQFLLAGNQWFELAPRETGGVSPVSAPTIRWFYEAGVDVLEPALKHASASTSARFPTATAEKWSPLFTRKIDVAPKQLFASRTAGTSTETLHIVGSDKTVQASWQRGEADFASSPVDQDSLNIEPSHGQQLTADFNNDGITDSLFLKQGRVGILLGGDATAEKPIEVSSAPIISVTHLSLCDFNRDGKFDFVAGGKRGCRVFFGKGNGQFREVTYACGEALGEEVEVADFLLYDCDGDRHEDLIVLATSGSPRVLSNQGFGVFREAKIEFAPSDRKLVSDESTRVFSAARLGAAVHTANGPAIDLAFTTDSGELALFRCDQAATKLPVMLHGARSTDSTIRVVAYDGGVCLGARNVTSDSVAQFAKFNKGPLDLKWVDAAGVQHKKRLIVLKPVVWELPSTSQRPME